MGIWQSYTCLCFPSVINIPLGDQGIVCQGSGEEKQLLAAVDKMQEPSLEECGY